MSAEELIAFEKDIAATYETGAIKAPIHLSGGNELPLLEIFKQIRPTDWVFSNWRSHYHALLHGIPPEKVKAEILAGRSISLQFPEHRFFTSAIVGGCIPIAVGVALAIKRDGGSEKVWVFVGDMTARTGIYWECRQYASRQRLNIRFVIEDNNVSVHTPTLAAWGEDLMGYGGEELEKEYNYQSKWPHSGTGVRVDF